MIGIDTLAPWDKQRPLGLYNGGSAEIPAFGCYEIYDSYRPDSGEAMVLGGGRTVLKVRQPTADNVANFGINGPIPLPAGQSDGFGTQDYPTYAAYDTANTPAFGEEWGPQNGSCLIKKGNKGLVIYGDQNGTIVRVARAPQATGVLFKKVSGEEVPAYGVAMVYGSGFVVNGETCYPITKYDGVHAEDQFLVNLDTAVANNEYGRGTWLMDGPGYALYEETDAVVTFKIESWGPIAGSWKLRYGGSGFLMQTAANLAVDLGARAKYGTGATARLLAIQTPTDYGDCGIARVSHGFQAADWTAGDLLDGVSVSLPSAIAGVSSGLAQVMVPVFDGTDYYYKPLPGLSRVINPLPFAFLTSTTIDLRLARIRNGLWTVRNYATNDIYYIGTGSVTSSSASGALSSFSGNGTNAAQVKADLSCLQILGKATALVYEVSWSMDWSGAAGVTSFTFALTKNGGTAQSIDVRPPATATSGTYKNSLIMSASYLDEIAFSFSRSGGSGSYGYTGQVYVRPMLGMIR